LLGEQVHGTVRAERDNPELIRVVVDNIEGLGPN
jgi:hypothetical protein